MNQQLLAGFSILCSFVAVSQRGISVPVPSAPNQQIAERASMGDVAAIEEAKRSANSWYVPFLLGYVEREMNRPRYPSDATKAATDAIAVLISTAQMQKMFCQAASDDALIPVNPQVRIVGGWFGIRTLQMLLTPEAHGRWERAMARHRSEIPNDVMYLPPSFGALGHIQDLVPNPPIRLRLDTVSPVEVDAAAKQWLDWIPAHARELEHLKPTGEGVIFSEKGCRAHVPTAAPTPAERQLEDRVMSGDAGAIQDAKRSGNKRYVSSLIGYVAQAITRAKPPTQTIAAARTALAALITTDQMQAFVCEALRGDDILPVSDRFRIVGGWFGVRSLGMFLTAEADSRWHSAMAKHRTARDVIYLPPKFAALDGLLEIVPNPPFRQRTASLPWSEVETAAKLWLDWIPAHARELQQLKPTGEGVVYSEKGCR